MALRDLLIEHFSLEEASGARIGDVSATSLTDTNTVTQNPGKVGSAAQFTAANSERLTIADNAAFSTGAGSFTVCAWLYLDSKGTQRVAVGKGNNSAQDEYGLDYNNVNDRFRFFVQDGSNVYRSADVVGSPSLGTWYFAVGWFDSSANTVNIQVNNGTAGSATANGGPVDRTGPFTIGAMGTAVFWDGRIDQVGFWKRVLTAAERTTLYNSGAGLAYSQYSQTYTRSLAGTLTTAGAAIKATSRSVAGTLSNTGALAKRTARTLGGILASGGSLTRRTARALAGSLPASGAVVRAIGRELMGALTGAGSVVKRTTRLVTGGLAPVGSVVSTVRAVGISARIAIQDWIRTTITLRDEVGP